MHLLHQNINYTVCMNHPWWWCLGGDQHFLIELFKAITQMTNSVFHIHALKIAHLSHLAQCLLKDLYTIPQLFYLEYHTMKPSSTL